MFQVQHTPGALADVLDVFKQNKINLTWIESFPYREAKGEYVFFVDFEGHRDDPKVEEGARRRWKNVRRGVGAGLVPGGEGGGGVIAEPPRGETTTCSRAPAPLPPVGLARRTTLH